VDIERVLDSVESRRGLADATDEEQDRFETWFRGVSSEVQRGYLILVGRVRDLEQAIRVQAGDTASGFNAYHVEKLAALYTSDQLETKLSEAIERIRDYEGYIEPAGNTTLDRQRRIFNAGLAALK